MRSSLSNEEILSWLRSKDPYEFENIIGDLWTNLGYSTEVLKSSNDRGIDIIAQKSDPFERTQLIQVKKYSPQNKIGSQKIREYRTLYDQEPEADRVVMITTGYFTPQATSLANDLDVEILNGEELVSLVRDYFGDLIKEISKEEDDKTGPQEIETDSSTSPNQNEQKEDEQVVSKGTVSFDPEYEYSDQIEEYEKEFDERRP